MDKRYQVFISSTYTDLKEERQAVIKTVIEASCIPAGMELFPAADEQQLAFIKRVIDDCDYYILIIGGRYGSVSENGLSYTEQEYDYAVGKNIPVIALIHESPGDIISRNTEAEPALREKLERFRKKVALNRLVKPWKNAQDLPGLVALSLQSEIYRAPGVGWVRANKIASEEMLQDAAMQRGAYEALEHAFDTTVKENEELRGVIAKLQSAPTFPDLAGLDEEIDIPITYWTSLAEEVRLSVKLKWREIFGYVSPYLIGYPREDLVAHSLAQTLLNKKTYNRALTITAVKMDDQTFKTIGIQLKALGLVNIEPGKSARYGMDVFWSLTRVGERLMMEVRAVRTAADETSTSAEKKDRLAGPVIGE